MRIDEIIDRCNQAKTLDDLTAIVEEVQDLLERESSDLVMADEDWSAMCKSLGENTQRICSPLQ